MDDTELFSRPQRFARVDRLVIILRGLPGSGKSSIAKNIQKLEAKFDKKTKIFTWDEYFEEVSSFRQSSVPQKFCDRTLIKILFKRGLLSLNFFKINF